MAKIVKVFLHTERPSVGPHEHDTQNGLIYRLLAITDEGTIASCASFLDTRVERAVRTGDITSEERDSLYSWGNAGIKGQNRYDTEDFAKKVFGGFYAGWVE